MPTLEELNYAIKEALDNLDHLNSYGKLFKTSQNILKNAIINNIKTYEIQSIDIYETENKFCQVRKRNRNKND